MNNLYRLNTSEGLYRLQEAAEKVENELNLKGSWDLEVLDAFNAAVEEAGVAIAEGIGSSDLSALLDNLTQRHPFASAEKAIQNLIQKLEA